MLRGIDFRACLLGALLLLTVPVDWLLAMVLAAGAHEGAHCLAVRTLGGRVYRLRFDCGGAVMETGGLGRSGELLAALAGPLGSFLLLFLIRWMPRTALCGLIQGLYNLLPIYPLDGGRALRCALGERWRRFGVWIEGAAVGGVFLLAAAASFLWRLGVFPLIWAGFLIIRALARKIPCKPEQVGVQ